MALLRISWVYETLQISNLTHRPSPAERRAFDRKNSPKEADRGWGEVEKSAKFRTPDLLYCRKFNDKCRNNKIISSFLSSLQHLEMVVCHLFEIEKVYNFQFPMFNVQVIDHQCFKNT
jgi:hypothetical protein